MIRGDEKRRRVLEVVWINSPVAWIDSPVTGIK